MGVVQLFEFIKTPGSNFLITSESENCQFWFYDNSQNQRTAGLVISETLKNQRFSWKNWQWASNYGYLFDF